MGVKDAKAYNVVIDSSHKLTNVLAREYRGAGNGHHFYKIVDKDGKILQFFRFQDGPIKEAGVNGIMDENLLTIVIDRLKGFQSGKFACEENAAALAEIELGLEYLKARTKGREARGVEGTHAV